MHENSKKKILVLYAKNSDELVNRNSAIGSYIFCLASLLHENGYQVFLNAEEFVLYETKTDSNHLTGNSNPSPFKKIVPKRLPLIYRDIKLFVNQNKLYNQLKNNDIFDVIIELYVYGSNVGYKLSKKHGIHLITIYDGPIVEEYKYFNGVKPFFLKLINKRQYMSLNLTNDIIVYSKSMKEYLLNKYNLKNSFHIHQNIDFSRLKFYKRYPKDQSDTKSIGFIGSFLKWHRVDLLIQSFNRLKKEKYNVKLYLVGEGQMFSEIQKEIYDSEYKEDIVLTGFLDGDELEIIKRTIDIGVMPGSNWYGAPVKIFEYGAAQMASVAPDRQTICDLFRDREEIIIFKNNSSEDLFQKLKYLLDNDGFVEKISVNLYEKIKSTYNKEKTLAFYQSLIH